MPEFRRCFTVLHRKRLCRPAASVRTHPDTAVCAPSLPHCALRCPTLHHHRATITEHQAEEHPYRQPSRNAVSMFAACRAQT